MGLLRDFSEIVLRAMMLSLSNRGTSRSTAAVRPRRSARQHPLGLEGLEGRVAPAVFVVTNSADSGDGSLRQAIIQSNSTPGPNEIDVASGLGPIVLTSGELLITNGVQIVGADTTVSGNHSSRVFEIAAGVGNPVTISGINIIDGDTSPIANGDRAADGGGILAKSDLTLISCTITGNTGDYGGGIINYGSLRLVGCTIADNHALGDGGGINNDGGTLDAENVNILNNSADPGAGVGGGFASGGRARFSTSNFIGNSAALAGGIFNEFPGTLDLEGGSISSNTSRSEGGGVWNRGVLTVADVQVNGNTAPGDGGGLWNGPSGTLNMWSRYPRDGLHSITSNITGGNGGGIENQGILNVTGYTISDNSASSFGGGIDDNGGTLMLDTSTVTVNSAMTGGGIVIRSGGTLVSGSNNVVSGNIGGDIIYTDPAPQITMQPASQTVTQGQSATLTVTASGPSLAYQWQHLVAGTWGNVGDNSPTLTIGNVTVSDSGSYRVVVSNSFGSVTSDTATLAVNPVVSTVALDSGSGAAGPFAADADFSGGTTYATTDPIDTTGVTDPAPQAVYQTERYGNFTYTIPDLVPGASYTVRLHFAEIYWSSPGQRLFNVAINGTPVLTNFDIVATAGGPYRAVVEQFTASADSQGKITIQYTSVRDNAKSSGIEVIPITTPVVAFDSGGPASGPFAADADVAGGAIYATSAAIDTSGVTDPAPQAVYQTERYGNFTYTIPDLVPGASYTVRLHFAEIYWSSPGQRLFNVAINGTPVLTNFDIFAAAGGKDKAIVEQFTTKANSSGQIVIQFTTVKDNAKLSGLEIQA